MFSLAWRNFVFDLLGIPFERYHCRQPLRDPMKRNHCQNLFLSPWSPWCRLGVVSLDFGGYQNQTCTMLRRDFRPAFDHDVTALLNLCLYRRVREQAASRRSCCQSETKLHQTATVRSYRSRIVSPYLTIKNRHHGRRKSTRTPQEASIP